MSIRNRLKLFVLSVIFLLLALSLNIFAHPGKTDANGGHYDHSTGEYHYHGTPDNDSSNSGSKSDSTDGRYGDNGLEFAEIILFLFFTPIVVIFVIIPIVSTILRKKREKSPHTQVTFDKIQETNASSLEAVEPKSPIKKYSEYQYYLAIKTYSKYDTSYHLTRITQDILKSLQTLKAFDRQKFELMLEKTAPNEWALKQLTYRILSDLKQRYADTFYEKETIKDLKRLYTMFLSKALEENYIDKELYEKRIADLETIKSIKNGE